MTTLEIKSFYNFFNNCRFISVCAKGKKYINRMGFMFSFSNHRIVKAQIIYIYIYIYSAHVSYIVLGERALLLLLLLLLSLVG
jgi:hypothetical protein